MAGDVVPYTCPRCGYATQRKDNMQWHLYTKKKVCQARRSPVTLTEDVKQTILRDRVYHAPPAPASSPVVQTIINNVNNFNVYQNFLGRIDTVDVIDGFAQHTQRNIVPFDRYVQDKYNDVVGRLQGGAEMLWRPTHLLEFVDDVSKANNVEEANLMYDNRTNRIKIYEVDGWRDFIAPSGMLVVIETIKDKLLDTYELALVHKVYTRHVDPREQSEARSFMQHLYDFLAVFDLEPRVSNMTNGEIMCDSEERSYDGDDSMTIEERCMAQYKVRRERLTSAEKSRVMRGVREIIRKNSIEARRNVFREVLALMHADEGFTSRLAGLAGPLQVTA